MDRKPSLARRHPVLASILGIAVLLTLGAIGGLVANAVESATGSEDLGMIAMLATLFAASWCLGYPEEIAKRLPWRRARGGGAELTASRPSLAALGPNVRECPACGVAVLGGEAHLANHLRSKHPSLAPVDVRAK